MHKSDINTEPPAGQMKRELLPDPTEMFGGLPACSFASVLFKPTLPCALWRWLGKSSQLQTPLNFKSWLNSVPLRYPKNNHSYCHKWHAILPHRIQSKPHFWSKPFITFVLLGHVSVLSAGFFPFSMGVRCGAHYCGTTAPHTRQTHQHPLSKTSQKAGTWQGAEFQQGRKHNPSGAESHSWTLKYNALISRSACSYKSNGFNANRARQWE